MICTYLDRLSEGYDEGVESRGWIFRWDDYNIGLQNYFETISVDDNYDIYDIEKEWKNYFGVSREINTIRFGVTDITIT